MTEQTKAKTAAKKKELGAIVKPAAAKKAVAKKTAVKTPVAKKPTATVAAKKKSAAPAEKKTAGAQKKVAATPAAKVAVKKAASIIKEPTKAKKAAPAKVWVKPNPEERYRMVETAAYFIAERNNFQGDPTAFWSAAEIEIATLLGE